MFYLPTGMICRGWAHARSALAQGLAECNRVACGMCLDGGSAVAWHVDTGGWWSNQPAIGATGRQPLSNTF